MKIIKAVRAASRGGPAPPKATIWRLAAGREVARGDRVTGMAVSQAHVVHRGVVYDLEVDTAHAESMECARAIAAHVR